MQHRMMGAALLSLAIAASPLAMAAGKKHKAAAQKPVEQAVVTDVAPPSGSWEAAPAPNKDYVWSKGYYEWKDGHYQWTPGEWVLKKEGMEYAQHQWVKRPDGKYELTGGKFVPSGEAKTEGAADEAKAASKESTKTSDAKPTADMKSMGAPAAAKR
jgi:hypothetical protein